MSERRLDKLTDKSLARAISNYMREAKVLIKRLGMQDDLDQAVFVKTFEAGRETPDIVPSIAAILWKS